MAAVAGSVAIATYMSSAKAESEFDYTPSQTQGTLVLSAFAFSSSGPNAFTQLPQARAAVERNMAVTGGHADFRRVWAGSDCDVYGTEENHCGSLELVKPMRQGPRLPAHRQGRQGTRRAALRRRAQEADAFPRLPRGHHGVGPLQFR